MLTVHLPLCAPISTSAQRLPGHICALGTGGHQVTQSCAALVDPCAQGRQYLACLGHLRALWVHRAAADEHLGDREGEGEAGLPSLVLASRRLSINQRWPMKGRSQSHIN